MLARRVGENDDNDDDEKRSTRKDDSTGLVVSPSLSRVCVCWWRWWDDAHLLACCESLIDSIVAKIRSR